MKRPEEWTEAELRALSGLADTIGLAMPSYTPHQLARLAIAQLCDELKIKPADLAAIKEGRARIVRYRKG